MKSVKVFDIEIPVYDYLTGQEWEQIELIIDDRKMSDLRKDISCIKVFVDSRTPTKMDVEETLKKAVPGDDIGAAVEELTAPFVSARRKRAERQLRTQAHLLSRPQLLERRTGLRATLAVIEQLLSERDGEGSKQSSSTTSQDSGSKGGKRGRSKKRSN